MTRLTRTRALLPPTRHPIEDDDVEVVSSDYVRLQEARSDSLTDIRHRHRHRYRMSL